MAFNFDRTRHRREYPYHKHDEVDYSKRPDGRFNKWQIWSAADWYDWQFSSAEDDLLANLDYPIWVLVDVVDSINLNERN
jgi:hypothetical protein